jgi:hydrogenase maturation protease
MNALDQLVQTLLYEGYLLYPYRADAIKNRQRFTFGALLPPAYCDQSSGADASSLQTECLVESVDDAQLRARVRFLRLTSREVSRLRDGGKPDAAQTYEPVESLEVDGQTHQTWQEAVEHEVALPQLSSGQLGRAEHRQPIYIPATSERQQLMTRAGAEVGQIVRRTSALSGHVTISAERLSGRLHKIRVRVTNDVSLDASLCADRDEALMNALVCAHVIMHLEGGEFVSLFDPSDACHEAAEACQQSGVWPVLVGDPPQRDTLLASPIILYDYPQIAPESPGDLCDGTEIDEILMLRIMTLTEDEKRAMRAVDDRSREILARTELMPEEQFMKMHGAIRGLRPVREKT